MFSIVIPGQPFGKPAVAGFDRRYRPTRTSDFYRTVAWLIGRQCPAPMRAPVVSIVAVKARPLRPPRAYPLHWGAGRNPCLAKPDADNIAKGVLDALRHAGIYGDDCQVSALYVQTLYAAEGEEPHTLVTVADVAQDARVFAANTAASLFDHIDDAPANDAPNRASEEPDPCPT